ncbi:MAG: sensor histidine kinase [Nocardioides sp.]
MTTTLLVALTVLGLSWLASGLALAARGSRVAGLLVALAGSGSLVGAGLAVGDRPGCPVVLTAAGSLVAPLALAVYPRPRWQHPVDFVSLVVLAGCGVVATVAWDRADTVGTLGLVSAVTLFAHTWWRIERSADRERRALQWMALSAGAAVLVTGLLGFATSDLLTTGLALVTAACVGPVLYVGIALPDVVEVRGLVVHLLVVSVAMVTFLALFVGLASLLEIMLSRPPGTGTLALAGAVLAGTFHPMRVALRGVVDELLFGIRPDPLDAAGLVAERIGDDPVLALRAIREALVLPYAALRVDGVELARSGVATTHTRTFALGSAGELVVGLRTGDLALTRDDEHVLGLTAPLLAQTLRARALAADLQESRGHAIAAIEEERRRLRRDLHDGLGPRLSGIAFTADAARNLLRSDARGAEQLLASLRAETTTAIQDIRGLVYGMRPPALDELGLVPALRQQAAVVRTRGGDALLIDVDAPDDLPPLPAAVEVAAYRIVLEALTNVGRHTTSTRASVRLAHDADCLEITVSDTDTARRTWTAGVGLASMGERATELGGRLSAGPTPHGGRVQATLPLGSA